MRKARDAVEHARALRDQYALVFALGVGAAVAQHARRADLARDFATECIELSERQLFSYWAAWGQIFGGWAEAVDGNPPLGIEQIRSGLDAYRATGATQLEPCGLTLLSDVLLLSGDLDGAEEALRAIDLKDPGTGSYFLAETWRVAAAVSHARREPHEKTTAKIGHAVDLARRQGAPTLELRALAWKAAFLPEPARFDLERLGELQGKVRLHPGSFDEELVGRALRQ
jgi:predicted ATPase